MVVTLIACWAWCSVHVTACWTGFCWKHVQTNRKQPDQLTAELRLWSACGLFLKMQPGHCIFYSYADWHPEKRAGALICQSPPPGNVSSWFERKRKSYRLQVVILEGDNKERSRKASKDITISYLAPRHNGWRQKVNSALWVVVLLLWQPITRRLPQGDSCSFADSQRYGDFSY